MAHWYPPSSIALVSLHRYARRVRSCLQDSNSNYLHLSIIARRTIASSTPFHHWITLTKVIAWMMFASTVILKYSVMHSWSQCFHDFAALSMITALLSYSFCSYSVTTIRAYRIASALNSSACLAFPFTLTLLRQLRLRLPSLQFPRCGDHEMNFFYPSRS